MYSLKGALIFLHGSGSRGDQLRLFLEALPLPSCDNRTFRQVLDSLNIQLFTPTSDTRPYTGCLGQVMNIWYDRASNWENLGCDDLYEDVEGANDSLNKVSLYSLINIIDYNYPFYCTI